MFATPNSDLPFFEKPEVTSPFWDLVCRLTCLRFAKQSSPGPPNAWQITPKQPLGGDSTDLLPAIGGSWAFFFFFLFFSWDEAKLKLLVWAVLCISKRSGQVHAVPTLVVSYVFPCSWPCNNGDSGFQWPKGARIELRDPLSMALGLAFPEVCQSTSPQLTIAQAQRCKQCIREVSGSKLAFRVFQGGSGKDPDRTFAPSRGSSHQVSTAEAGR